MIKWEHQRGNWRTKINWIWNYERDDFPRYMELAKKYSKPTIILKSNQDIDKCISRLKQAVF